MTILPRNATVWALDYQLGLLVLSQLAPTADGLTLPVVQRVGSLTSVCLNRPSPSGRGSTTTCGFLSMLSSTIMNMKAK